MITIYGASGHAKVIINIIRNNNGVIRQVLDDNESLDNILGYEICKPRNKPYSNVIVAIGNNSTRKSVVDRLIATSYTSIIHNSAVLDPNTNLGLGTVIMAGVVINSSVSIGNHCIINTSAIIEHDIFIDDFVHVSPGAILTGGVKVGQCSHIGAGAIILPNIKIGNNVTIGAGAVVTKNVKNNMVMVGNPARPLLK